MVSFNQIPQSDANPLLEELNRPWVEAQQRKEDEMQTWRSQSFEALDRAVLDWDAATADKSLRLDFAIDEETARKQGLVESYLYIANEGREFPSSTARDLMRDEVAHARFGGLGAGSDEAFFAEIQKESQGRKTASEIANSLGLAASTSELVRSTNEAGVDSMSWELWREEARKKPGFDRAKEAEYYETWNRTREEVRNNLEPIIGPLSESWKAVQSGEMNLGDAYGRLDPDEREPFLASLAILAKTLPAEEQATFWTNLRKSAGRGIAQVARDTMAGLRDEFTTPGGEMSVEAERFMKRQAAFGDDFRTPEEKVRDQRNFEADIERIRSETYDPVKVLNKDNTFLRIMEKGAYAAPGALASTAVAAIPFAGTGLTFGQMEQAAYRDMRLSLMNGGMSDAEASEIAGELGPLIAIPQAALEKVGAGALIGKLPGFERVMQATANRITNSAARFGARTVAAGVYETGIENVQDLLPQIAQETAAALNQDVPGVVWKNGKDGFLDGYWENTGATFVAVLPLAVIAGAGGIREDARVRAYADTPDLHLKAFGHSEEAIKAIRDAQAKGQFTANAVIEQELSKRNPQSEQAKVAVAEIEAAAKAQQEAIPDAQASGVLPRFHRDPDGWTVFDGETGAEVGTAPNVDEAMRLASAHSSAIDETNAEQTAFLGSMLEAGEITAQTEGTTFDFRPGERTTVAQQASQSERDEARVLEQVAAKERLEGSGEFSGIVLGSSTTEFKQRVRDTVNRINAGGSVLTVFHEESHGFFREALAQGRLTMDETVQTLRALDSVLAAKSTRNGQSLQFLPDGEVTETQVDEAVAELMESEILRKRKSGTRTIPAGLVTRNLNAMARLAPGAAKKFSRFLNTVREFWGMTFRRATAIKQAIREGTVKEADLEGFTSKLFGLDQQDEHNAAALREAEEILGGELLEGDPFSLGPAKMADILAREAASRAANPKAKAQVMSGIARRMGGLRREADQLITAFGATAVRKAIAEPRTSDSIRREGAFREAAKRAELEDAAMAKWGALLTDDDLVRLRSQPVHAFLSHPKSRLKGRLRSKGKFIRNQGEFFQSAAEYDGSEMVSRTLFGGALSPDQAASELFEEGLIRQPTPEAMWQALETEAQSVTTMKRHRQQAEDEIRAARVAAKQEANEWTSVQLLEQRANYSPKARLLRALAMMDGIVAALPPALRGYIGGYTQLAKLGSDEKRIEFLKGRIEKVERVVNDYLKREYNKQMEALLDRAKPAKGKPGEKPKGKAGAEVHALFDTLRKAMKWGANEVDAHVAALDSQIAKGEMSPEQEAHATLEAGLVSLVGNWRDADAARRAAAVQEATSVFEAGYATFRLKKLQEKEDREIRRAVLAADTGTSGTRAERDARALKDNGLKGGWKDNFLSLGSFEQVAQYIFGLESEESRRIVDMERAASDQKSDAVQEAMDGVDNLFTSIAGTPLKGEQLRWDLSQKSINAGGISLSPLEAITATLMWRQEDGRRHMEGRKDDTGKPAGPWNYDQAFIDEIESKLSPEALAVRAYIAGEYAKEYDRLNPIYRELNGVNLPRNENYSPITVAPQQAQSGQMVDPVTGSTMTGASTTPGSLRTRGSSISEPRFVDALQTFIAHTKQMEHWMAYAPFNAEAGAMLRNRELGNAVEAKGGEQALSVLRSWLDFFVQGGNRDASAHLALNQTVNRMASRGASATLVGRLGVLAIQTTQLGAGLAEMPTGAFLSRFGKLLTGQLGWGAAFRSDYIQRRLQQMPPVVQQAMEGLRTGKPNELKHQVRRIGRLISGVDALMTAGTFAMVHDYQMKEAVSLGLSGSEAEAYAMQQAERAVDRIAQPTRPGARSLFENTSSSTPALRVLWAFASESRQKLALAVWRMADPNRSLGEKVRAAAVTWVVGGMIATIIRSAWRDLRNDDDDEVFDERNWGVKRLVLASLTGPFQGLPFLGELAEAGLYKLTGEFHQDSTILEAIPRAFTAATRVTDWGDRKPDEIMKDVDELLGGAAFSNDTLSAASSLMHLVRDLYSVAENIAD